MLIDETAKSSAKLVLDVVIGKGWDEDAPTHPEVPPTGLEEVLEEIGTHSDLPVNIIQSHVQLLMSGDTGVEEQLRHRILCNFKIEE